MSDRIDDFQLLPMSAFWETLTRNLSVESLPDAIGEGLQNIYDAYCDEGSTAANRVTIIHNDGQFIIVDRVRKALNEQGLKKLHRAFVVNNDHGTRMGQHGVGFYIMLRRIISDNLDDNWMVLSSPKGNQNVYVAQQSRRRIAEDRLPVFKTVSIDDTDADSRMIHKSFLQYMARIKKVSFEMPGTAEALSAQIIQEHGTVLLINTSRKFGEGTLKSFYHDDVIPGLQRQIHLHKGGRIEVEVEGERTKLSHSPFVNMKEAVEVSFKCQGGKWGDVKIQAIGAAEELKLIKGTEEYPFTRFRSKQHMAPFINHLKMIANEGMPKESCKDGNTFKMTVSFRVGDIKLVESLVGLPYTSEKYQRPKDLLKLEGLMASIQLENATFMLGRVHSVHTGQLYQHRRNYPRTKGRNSHPASMEITEGREQLHRASVVMGPWELEQKEIRIQELEKIIENLRRQR
eukprot:g2426.t1